MDKVRFGRALGKGTRAAAKSLWEAADAAAAPDPSARAKAAAPSRNAPASAAAASRKQAPRANPLQAGRAARAAGQSVLAPMKKFSSVLWLEVTGAFFALIALFLAQGVWKLRHAVYGSAEEHKLAVYAILCAVFVYFTVSNFVRAHRRGKK